ncbi:hypothetical protein ACTMTJ_16645 [Phytohabitans sp. LJ34]|uniref:hypothetical protein n=1 Tax=Phytohabitans sp. LJ34 TaxID=3452217 RepID=UPI003F8AB4AE
MAASTAPTIAVSAPATPSIAWPPSQAPAGLQASAPTRPPYRRRGLASRRTQARYTQSPAAIPDATAARPVLAISSGRMPATTRIARNHPPSPTPTAASVRSSTLATTPNPPRRHTHSAIPPSTASESSAPPARTARIIRAIAGIGIPPFSPP